MFTYAIGNEKLCVFRPSVAAFGETHFFFAKRLAMRRCSVLQIWCAVADVAIQYDERRTAFRLREDSQGVLYPINVVGITDSQDVPTVTQESGGDVLCKGDAGVSLDGDVVVIVDPAEIVELQVCR